jgi:hypothetical protein
MRYLIGIALTLTCLIGQVHAQSYNGFQTNGVHSCFFSLSWNGKAHIGFGYNFRNFESSFSDYQLEARIPLDNIENLENYSIIGGIYRPSRLQRTFVGGGAHLILIKSEEGMQLDINLAAIPSYVFAAPLDRKPYSTAGVLLTYQTSLLGSSGFLSSNSFGTGVHADVLLERTLGLSANYERVITYKDKGKTWSNRSSYYGGSTYRLFRN